MLKKLILTCACGQRIQLPRNAVGKTGICPTCHRAIPITKDNTKPLTAKERERARIFNASAAGWKGNPAETEEARRLFGRAADLYCEGRYGEALAIFDSLARRFPGIPEIENARQQCLAARARGPMALPGPEGMPHAAPKADPDTVRDFVLQKMFHARSEEVQLQAAELMARILGMLGTPAAAPNTAQETDRAPEASEDRADAEQESSVPETDEAPNDTNRVSFSEFAADPNRLRAR